MPLDPKTGNFICPDCNSRHGFLPEEPPMGQARFELICTKAHAQGDDAPADTATAYTGVDGHRHHAVDPADVDAYYLSKGKQAPSSAAEAA